MSEKIAKPTTPTTPATTDNLDPDELLRRGFATRGTLPQIPQTSPRPTIPNSTETQNTPAHFNPLNMQENIQRRARNEILMKIQKFVETIKDPKIKAIYEYSLAQNSALLEEYAAYNKSSALALNGVSPEYALQLSDTTGERMKFLNPLIWILYKHTAYLGEPGKQMISVESLLLHCSGDDQICGRRLSFLKQKLAELGMEDIFEKYKGQSITDFLMMKDVLEFLNRDDILSEWLGKETDRRGKWFVEKSE